MALTRDQHLAGRALERRERYVHDRLASLRHVPARWLQPSRGMGYTRDEAGEVAAIRARIESWAAAVRARDVRGALSHYAPEVVSYDIAPPLAHLGASTLREELAEWFSTFRGPVGFTMRDLTIAAGDGVGFAHALSHMTGEKTSGESMDIWVRTTIGLRKIGDEWKVVHEHSSVPLRMDGSNRGAVDLVPDLADAGAKRGEPGLSMERGARVPARGARGAVAFAASALAAVAVGALSLGAVAVGALSLGALAIARVAIRSARIRRLRIQRLEIEEIRAPGSGAPLVHGPVL